MKLGDAGCMTTVLLRRVRKNRKREIQKSGFGKLHAYIASLIQSFSAILVNLVAGMS